MPKKYLDEDGLAVLWAAIKARDLNIVNSATVYGAVRDGAGNTISTTYININQKGVNNGVATLGADGKIPSSQLPSYVDDVLEYAGKSSFPGVGEGGKIYVSTSDNKTYRWSGTQYTEISASLAIGTVEGTAFDGGVGKQLKDDFIRFRDGIASGSTSVGFASKATSADKATYDKNGKDISTYYLPVDTHNAFVTAICTDGTRQVKSAAKAQEAANAGYAAKASNDELGRNIQEWYLSKTDAANAYAPKSLVATVDDKVTAEREDKNNIVTVIHNNGDGNIYMEATDGQDHNSYFNMSVAEVELQGDDGNSLRLNEDGVFVGRGSAYSEVLDASMALTNTEIDAILV